VDEDESLLDETEADVTLAVDSELLEENEEAVVEDEFEAPDEDGETQDTRKRETAIARSSLRFMK
jgi:hypothetical protein